MRGAEIACGGPSPSKTRTTTSQVCYERYCDSVWCYDSSTAIALCYPSPVSLGSCYAMSSTAIGHGAMPKFYVTMLLLRSVRYRFRMPYAVSSTKSVYRAIRGKSHDIGHRLNCDAIQRYHPPYGPIPSVQIFWYFPTPALWRVRMCASELGYGATRLCEV